MKRLLLLAACALIVSGCGNKFDEVHQADTEGIYLDLGGLQYQVQISRQLNPNDIEDQSYLQGVPPALSHLATGDSWFAVFIRVENGSEHRLPAATEFSLADTRNNVYEPVPIAKNNPFAYEGGMVAPKGNLPPNQSVAQLNESVNGSLLLFKVPYESYANRPLQLTIRAPGNPKDKATVDLDV